VLVVIEKKLQGLAILRAAHRRGEAKPFDFENESLADSSIWRPSSARLCRLHVTRLRKLGAYARTQRTQRRLTLLPALNGRERVRTKGRSSGSFLLTLEPSSYFVPGEIDAVVNPPPFRKAELRVVTPAPQGDGANAEPLAEPRRNHKLCCGVVSAERKCAFTLPMFADLGLSRLSPLMHVTVSCFV
jgi:hypothetical protein